MSDKPTLISAAKACFNGELGSAIRVDGKLNKPTEEQKHLCAATEIGKAAAGRGVKLDDPTLNLLIEDAQSAYTPKGKPTKAPAQGK